MVMISGSVV